MVMVLRGVSCLLIAWRGGFGGFVHIFVVWVLGLVLWFRLGRFGVFQALDLFVRGWPWVRCFLVI